MMNKRKEDVPEQELLDQAEAMIQETEEFLEEKKKSRWGGARPGSGPKPKAAGERADTQINYRLTKSQVEALDNRVQGSESRNQTARRLLLEKLEGEG